MDKDRNGGREVFLFTIFTIVSILLLICLCGAGAYARNKGVDSSLVSVLLFGIVLGAVSFLTGICLYRINRRKTVTLKEMSVYQEELTTENEKRYAQTQKAEHENAAKTALLNSMAIQVRTPLSTILGMGELLKEREEDANRLEYIENIYSAGKIIESLLSDLADLSKIEQGSLYIEEAAYSIAEVVRETYTLTKVSALAKSVDFQLELDESMPSILRGDGKRMKQVILNLLANAITYTPIGQVIYHVGYEKVDENSIRLDVSVKDTGIGIKKEDMDRAFLHFNNSMDPVDRVLDGMGLGLTVTNQILKQMGSFLAVESEYGQGSVFHFSVIQEVIETAPVGKKEEVIHGGKEVKRDVVKSFVAPNARILAVDDNRMNLAVMNGILKRTKVQIHCVNSGQECLEAVAKEQYHLIFLDLLMPEMSGEQTLKKMQKMKDNKSADAPVIAVTASTAKGARNFYIKHGFTDYITKPIDMATIYQLLNEYLPKELIMNPDSAQQQLATDVIEIQENIVKEYSAEDVERVVQGVKRAMIDFDIEKAAAALNKLAVSKVPEEYGEDIRGAIACMEKEDFENVARYLDKMLKDTEL